MILLRLHLWGCQCHRARRARHSRTGGPRAALDRGRHPETPGRGALNWGTRERDTLDVRCETPERQRHLADSDELRDRIEPGEAERGTAEAQAPPRSGYPTGGDPSWVCHVPRRGSEREDSHYSPRQNRRPSIVVKKQETRQRTASAVESRPDFLGPPPTAAAKIGSSFGPTPSAMTGRQRLCSPRARPKAAGRFAVELERGARLYRAPAQLSISQRVRRAPPDAGPTVDEGALKHRAAGAKPRAGEPGQLPPALGAVNDGVSRWTP